jgi:hypothetical protein
MQNENDWTRLAMSLDAIRETLLDGTHGVFASSDSVTVKTDTWVQTVIELRRAQKQCAAYGETHRTSDPVVERNARVERLSTKEGGSK